MRGQNGYGKPVEATEVTIGVTTALDPYRVYTRPTNELGRAVFDIRSRFGGLWEVCVTDVVRDGFTYDRSQNDETCDSIAP